MKKAIRISLFGAIAFIPLAALAEGEGFYVGLGVGESSMNVNDSGFNTESTDEKDALYKIFGGYQFSKFFGVEGGYVELGNVNNVYRVNNADISVDSRFSTYYVAATGTLTLGESFSLFAKVGATSSHSSANAATTGTPDVSGTNTDVMYGVGGAYNFGKHWAVALEYEDYGKIANDAKADTIFLSGRYKF